MLKGELYVMGSNYVQVHPSMCCSILPTAKTCYPRPMGRLHAVVAANIIIIILISSPLKGGDFAGIAMALR